MCIWLIFVTCLRRFGIHFILVITTQWNYRLPEFRYDCGKLGIFGQIQIFRRFITLKLKYICSFVAKETIKRVTILFWVWKLKVLNPDSDTDYLDWGFWGCCSITPGKFGIPYCVKLWPLSSVCFQSIIQSYSSHFTSF
jgi:hypothetical protein